MLCFPIAGRLVGAVCAMTGILVIAMPIPIIVNNFTRQYQRLKPVSKYWSEFELREKREEVRARKRIILGLFGVNDLCEEDLLTTRTRKSSTSLNKLEILDENVNNIEAEVENEISCAIEKKQDHEEVDSETNL